MLFQTVPVKLLGKVRGGSTPLRLWGHMVPPLSPFPKAPLGPGQEPQYFRTVTKLVPHPKHCMKVGGQFQCTFFHVRGLPAWELGGVLRRPHDHQAATAPMRLVCYSSVFFVESSMLSHGVSGLCANSLAHGMRGRIQSQGMRKRPMGLLIRGWDNCL